MKVIHPVNSMLTDALDLCTYRLVNRDETYSDRISQRISKLQKRLKAQMRDQVFDAIKLITILLFFKTFNTVCD